MGLGYTKFAIETLIDEVARGMGADPLAYRIDLLNKKSRGQAVLKAVAMPCNRGAERQTPAGVAFADGVTGLELH